MCYYDQHTLNGAKSLEPAFLTAGADSSTRCLFAAGTSKSSCIIVTLQPYDTAASEA